MTMTSRRKQPWQVGDTFRLPLMNGQAVLGQIVGREPDMLNSVTIALFDSLSSPSDGAESDIAPDWSRAFAVLFSTPDLLDSGVWKTVGSAEIQVPKSQYPYEHLRERRFVGATVVGSGIIRKFANAFYGLLPWDAWHDPNYLDGLLLSPSKKPISRLTFKSAGEG